MSELLQIVQIFLRAIVVDHVPRALEHRVGGVRHMGHETLHIVGAHRPTVLHLAGQQVNRAAELRQQGIRFMRPEEAAGQRHIHDGWIHTMQFGGFQPHRLRPGDLQHRLLGVGGPLSHGGDQVLQRTPMRVMLAQLLPQGREDAVEPGLPETR